MLSCSLTVLSLCKSFRQINYLVLLIAVTFLTLCFFISTAQGSGFALVQQGTAAMAQGNAFVADASDASAIFYNPAGLSQLKRAQVYQGSFLNYPDRDFSGGGQDSQTNHRIYKTITTYIAIPLHKRVAVGIGFFSPFGMGTVWPPTWAGRYLTTYSSMKTYNLNPVISVKVLDNLSIAAGIDMLWSKVQLKRKSPVVIRGVTLPDAEVNLKGDGAGTGYNFGLLYEPLSGVKLGVAYRSQISLTHYGDLTTTRPSPLPATPPVKGSASLTFPASLTAGISYSRLNPFTFEFDTTWTGWSSYSKFKTNLDTPIVANGVRTRTVTVPKNWHDAWAFRFGVNYKIKEGMKVRAGYIYDLTPVPDSSFDPQVPDANRHIFTVGGDIKVLKRFTLGIAYNFILAEERTKNNAIPSNGVPAPLQANGNYTSNVHSLGLSCAFQF
ncbi:MAG: outer membrane protein transport protein [Deltaproteobacteria bacterium]|jgi:long-chain fatty acid transport protein